MRYQNSSRKRTLYMKSTRYTSCLIQNQAATDPITESWSTINVLPQRRRIRIFLLQKYVPSLCLLSIMRHNNSSQTIEIRGRRVCCVARTQFYTFYRIDKTIYCACISVFKFSLSYKQTKQITKTSWMQIRLEMTHTFIHTNEFYNKLMRV